MKPKHSATITFFSILAVIAFVASLFVAAHGDAPAVGDALNETFHHWFWLVAGLPFLVWWRRKGGEEITMASVNFDTTRALTSEEIKNIEQRFGYEIVCDSDDFEEGHRYFNYFWGFDNEDNTPEENEELLSRDNASEACEYLETLPVIVRARVRPYSCFSTY